MIYEIEKKFREKIKILLVDDDPYYRSKARSIIEIAGYTAVEAEDSKKALKLLENERYHIILLDQNMKDLNGKPADEAGFELGLRIKQIDQYCHIDIHLPHFR